VPTFQHFHVNQQKKKKQKEKINNNI